MSNELGYNAPLPRRIATGAFRLPVVAILGGALLLRVITDDRSAADSRHTGSLNLSGVIAVALILLAGWLLLRNRRGLGPALIASMWLCVWTAVAVTTRGASTETIREGVREASIVAVAVIAFNCRGEVTTQIAARLAQVAGLVPAVLAIYQLATSTGMLVAGNIRAHGTFAHPNSAAVFFALAATVSLWLYLDRGRGWWDLAALVLFAAALIATFSIDGLITVVAMMVVFGILRPSPLSWKRWPLIAAALIAVVFFATPLGAARVSKETSTSLAAVEDSSATTTLDWRLYKWKALLRDWQQAPLFGQGLGTTITEEGSVGSIYAGALPHNEYIRYLVETGVVGFGLLLLGVVAAFMALVRAGDFRNRTADEHGSLAVALAVFVGFLVNALADNTLLYTASCYAAALVVATALASSPARASRASTAQPS